MNAKLIIGNKNYSSWSLRAWLLLREAGIAFDEQLIALDTADFGSQIAALSAARRVPVLQLNGMTVWDSLAIAETVAEHWPEKNLWPDAVASRAHARAISAEMHSGFFALRECLPMNCRAMDRKVPISDRLGEDIDRVLAIWSECYRLYGSKGGWLFGDFSIADAMYAPVVLRFRTYGINLPESASVYPQRLLESAAMQEWLAAAELETEVLEGEEVGQ